MVDGIIEHKVRVYSAPEQNMPALKQDILVASQRVGKESVTIAKNQFSDGTIETEIIFDQGNISSDQFSILLHDKVQKDGSKGWININTTPAGLLSPEQAGQLSVRTESVLAKGKGGKFTTDEALAIVTNSLELAGFEINQNEKIINENCKIDLECAHPSEMRKALLDAKAALAEPSANQPKAVNDMPKSRTPEMGKGGR